MVTRVRVEAEGPTASEVERHLLVVADLLDEHLKWNASRGEQVIQKNLGEPPDDVTSFSGRLILHGNVAPDSGQMAILYPDAPSSSSSGGSSVNVTFTAGGTTHEFK